MPPDRRTAQRSALSGDVRAVLPAWLAARAVVVGSWVAAKVVGAWLAPLPVLAARALSNGILGWDAAHYLHIARLGYVGSPTKDLRFFPLLPILVGQLDRFVPGPPGVTLLLVANVAALAFAVAIRRLALHESGDAGVARRAVWFATIGPAAFVLVWGYTEPLWLLLTAIVLLAARRGRWIAAAVAGFLAGTLRPVAVLLVLPVLVEAVRARPRDRADVAAALAAIGAPLAGTAAFLLYVWRQFGDPLLPYRIQQLPTLRGPAAGPLRSLSRPAADLFSGHVTVESVRTVWVALAVVLVVIIARRLPASYAALAVATLVVALSATRLGSFERYVFLTVPVALVLALATEREWVERTVLATAAATMALYGLLALLGAYVP
ncbi:MAG TPA: hypothetical protein VHN98_12940 [Acidimicrobiales bacterium]|nr:hypothetical protein [Acidimicrobiales bacterium]